MENKTGWKRLSYLFILGFIVGVLVVVMIQNIRSASDKSNGDKKLGDDKNGIVIEEAVASVSNQNAGDTVLVSSITVPKVSWVAVRENNFDVMGRILGAKKLQPGEYEGVLVELLRPTTAHVMYAIVIYEDDEDGVFNHEIDIPLQNKDGGEIFARFSVN